MVPISHSIKWNVQNRKTRKYWQWIGKVAKVSERFFYLFFALRLYNFRKDSNQFKSFNPNYKLARFIIYYFKIELLEFLLSILRNIEFQIQFKKFQKSYFHQNSFYSFLVSDMVDLILLTPMSITLNCIQDKRWNLEVKY